MLATIILGSNSGDKRETIEKAIAILSGKAGRMVNVSSYYETEPWGFECFELFLNRVAIFDTQLSAEKFLDICLETEQLLGRTRPTDSRYASRTIDIDILFFGSEIIDTATLTVPHPRMALRNFVLVPLNEIMPDFIHPVLHKKISGLLSECPDTMTVKRLGNQP